MPTLFVMVGLVASGKTVRAKEIERINGALRFTPDEWMIPLFGKSDPYGKKNVLEGRLIWVAMRALRLGVNVVLDFGVWTKDERTALRFLASEAGARCELVYLEVDESEQIRRHDEGFSTDPDSTFPFSLDDHREYRRRFEVPTEDELRLSEIAPPPTGYTNWVSWATERWPTSV